MDSWAGDDEPSAPEADPLAPEAKKKAEAKKKGGRGGGDIKKRPGAAVAGEVVKKRPAACDGKNETVPKGSTKDRNKDGFFQRHKSDLPCDLIQHVGSLRKHDQAYIINNLVKKDTANDTWFFDLGNTVVKD